MSRNAYLPENIEGLDRGSTPDLDKELEKAAVQGGHASIEFFAEQDPEAYKQALWEVLGIPEELETNEGSE